MKTYMLDGRHFRVSRELTTRNNPNPIVELKSVDQTPGGHPLVVTIQRERLLALQSNQSAEITITE